MTSSNDTLTNAIAPADISQELEQLEKQIEKNPNFIKEYFENSIPSLINFGLNVLFAIIIYFVGKKIIKIILKMVKRAFERAGADVGVMNFVNSVIKILLYVILFLIIGGRFGIQATSVIAIIGSLGIAVGLALQDSMSNFAGGILLLLLKPFKIGDYIVDQSTGYEGTVSEISLYYTKLITVDNKVLCLPNGKLVNSSITNVTDQEIRRLDIYVGIGYDSDIKKAKEILTSIIISDEARIKDKEYNVFVSQLGDSSVELGMRMWVNSSDYWSAKWRMTEAVKLQFDENNIEIPYNKIDVNIKEK